jgi:hypothetical protein
VACLRKQGRIFIRDYLRVCKVDTFHRSGSPSLRAYEGVIPDNASGSSRERFREEDRIRSFVRRLGDSSNRIGETTDDERIIQAAIIHRTNSDRNRAREPFHLEVLVEILSN